MSIPNLLATGGLVMVPLLGLSILAMALVLERLVFWWQLTRQQDRVIQDTLALYRRSPAPRFKS